jgi:integrase
MNEIQPLQDHEHALAEGGALTYNFAAVLPGRASSEHTQRAYFRWVDKYLTEVGGLRVRNSDERLALMRALPVDTLRQSLSAPQLRAWLGGLVAGGAGKQGANQARASIITLASLLSEAGWLDDYTSSAMRNVRLPSAADGQRPGRWLSLDQVKMLMMAARRIGTTENQIIRNNLAITMLCTMALRRDELATARWSDLSIQNNRMVLQVHGKGKKTAIIDVPKPVQKALAGWRRAMMAGGAHPEGHTALVRRIWKGGRISRHGLTPDGIWLIINEAADEAQIGHVAPHDLRRSVAGALHESGVTIDKISRLLRHSNVAVTERYLSRLPQRNEGAVLMSDMLGLEDEDDEWPGF